MSRLTETEPHIHLPDGSCCRPKRFAHLHQHTQYSLLDGAAKIKDLLSWAKEVTPEGQAPAIAMTDHGNMHGAVNFYLKAQELEVKPILGYEAYVIPGFGTRRDRKMEAGEKSSEKSIFHLTLLARDFEGYQNLCRLSSLAYTEGYYYKPRIDHELLEEYSKGIIAMSGCLGSEVQQLLLNNKIDEARERLLWYRDLFGENYFIEIQNHGLPEQQKNNPILKEWAHEFGIGMVATNDGHYVKKKDAEAHDALLAIQTKSTLADENRFKFSCDDFYVKDLDEMQKVLPTEEWGEEIYDNTVHIADLCDVHLPVGKKRVYQMPALPIPEGRTMAEELRIKTYLGLLKRYSEDINEGLLRDYAWRSFEILGDSNFRHIEKKEDVEALSLEQVCELIAKMGTIWGERSIQAGEKYTVYPALNQIEEEKAYSKEATIKLRRAEYELSVIINMGFPDYFLIVADYIQWARAEGILVGPGRGSGAGSLVAYCLTITNIEPLQFGLLFERFLNPERISMPDFDIDFDDVRRQEVIDYVRRKYGDDKVAMICTFGSLSSKAALKDVGRVMGLDYGKVDKISKLIPVKLGKSFPLEEAEKAVPDIRQLLDEDPEVAKAYQFAKQLEGLTRHSSMHAAGVIIGREKLSNLVPLMRDSSGDNIVCQYDMKSLEELGLIKMDFLGLRTLSFLGEAQRILKESGTDFDEKYGSFDNIPLDSEATYELLSRGDTKGVFQLEGAGIAGASRRMKPKCFNDIVALSALYRPGPMENIPTYVRRHHGLEEVDYSEKFPNCEQWLEPILRETYGIPVYQEQIMEIASKVAGYSLGQADSLRRAMGKKDKNAMFSHQQTFIEKAGEKGVPEKEAADLFMMLDKFADYGFNKSHSAAYGIISYQTAWLKAHYPVQFMAALLTVERQNSDKVAEYISDARKMKIKVLPPDINRSSSDFRVVGSEILFGLYAIKGLGEGVVIKILQERERGGAFVSLAQFCSRIGHRVANRKAMESLIKSGAFDCFGERKQMLESLEEAMNWAQGAAAHQNSGMNSLFGLSETAPEPALKDTVPFTPLEMLKAEKEVLGLYISGHPLEQYEGLREAASCSINELEEWYLRQHQQSRVKAVLGGMIENVVKKPTKSGKMMARFVLTDDSGQIELVAFGRSYERIEPKLQSETPVLIIVEIESEEGSLRAVAQELVEWSQLSDVPKVMYIDLNLEEVSSEDMSDFHSLLDEYSGTLTTFFRLHTTDEIIIYELENGVGSSQCAKALNEHCPWLNASLAYDQKTILSRFAPKPQYPQRSRA